MGKPTLAGFIEWVRNVMQVTIAQLPDNSIFFVYAYNVAIDIVNRQLCGISSGGVAIYTLAVYNCAGSNLLQYAVDDPSAPFYNDSDKRFFAYTRDKFNINGFVSGIIQSTSDEGTSSSFVVQEAAKNFTLSDLQYLKDPYGRQYLAFAQRAGSLWGLT